MLTIALDEQGDFENLNNKLSKQPVFIGGILYDDCGDIEDYQLEKKRLQQYLKNVCFYAGTDYPKDLHYCSEGYSSNSKIVKEVKTLFGKTIKEFLENGTWEKSDFGMKPRKG